MYVSIRNCCTQYVTAPVFPYTLTVIAAAAGLVTDQNCRVETTTVAAITGSSLVPL